jgi:hypothetical protein
VKEYTIQEFLDEDTEFSEVVSSIEFVVIKKINIYYLKGSTKVRKEEEFKDFKEFCKSNLAFLIDAGFTVDVSYAMYGGGFMLEVMRKGNGLFNWEEIKYDFIPL